MSLYQNRYQTHQICPRIVDGERCCGLIRVIDSRPTVRSLRRRRRCLRCGDTYTTFEMKRTDLDAVEKIVAMIGRLKKPLDAATALVVEITGQQERDTEEGINGQQAIISDNPTG